MYKSSEGLNSKIAGSGDADDAAVPAHENESGRSWS